MGACTVTVISAPSGNFKSRGNSVHFNKRIKRAIIAPSSSYATGGDSISLATLGLAHVDYATVVSSEGGTRSGMQIPSTSYRNGKGCTVDVTTPTAPKLKLYTAANTEDTATTDNSAQRWLIEFYGQ